VTELDQDLDPLAAGVPERFRRDHCRVCGSRAVTEAVQYAEQGGLSVDADSNRLIPTDMLAGAWPSGRRPFDWP
jgi:hypothetical protein